MLTPKNPRLDPFSLESSALFPDRDPHATLECIITALEGAPLSMEKSLQVQWAWDALKLQVGREAVRRSTQHGNNE